MSDRQQEVLNAIDATLSGYTDYDDISHDAMRWSPRELETSCTCTVSQPCEQHVPYPADSFAAALTRFTEVTSMSVEEFTRLADAARSLPVDARRLHLNRTVQSASSDSIPVRISPAEAVIPGPNGPIHIRGAYGDEPMQVTEIDPDDIEEERT